jgi:hypothetical protein
MNESMKLYALHISNVETDKDHTDSVMYLKTHGRFFKSISSTN